MYVYTPAIFVTKIQSKLRPWPERLATLGPRLWRRNPKRESKDGMRNYMNKKMEDVTHTNRTYGFCSCL